MVSARQKTAELEKLRKKYELGGGQKAIDKLHARGKLTARERIDLLVDPGSFREFNLWAQPTRTGFDVDLRDNPGDAMVTGYGRVDGRPVCIYAHDFTILGGTQASVQYWKACKVMDTAVRLGIPYIGLVDSGGVRIQDAFGINAGSGVSRDADLWYSSSVTSGVVPSISLVLGASYAGTAYSPFLADAFFMVDKPYCHMSLASPELLKSVTFQDVTRDEIGAARLHAEVTGSCDYLGESEEAVVLRARELLSYLPANCRERPPILDTGDDPRRTDEGLIDLISSESDKPCDMHEIITRIVDDGKFLELKSEYAGNMIVGFARLGGRSAGIVANNPAVLDGALDYRACEKEARFVRYCDAFNVPLVFLVDTPGFVSEQGQDHEGLERHAAMASYAVCEATVPKIVLHVGRCFNNGQMAMGTRLMGADAVMAWPTADIRFADFDESLEAVYGKGKEDIDQVVIERFSERYFDSPKCPASLLIVDDIFNPKDTRSVLIDTLSIVEKKAVTRPEKKNGNLPL
jgi:acetyl-CoA carboxylase carboxyltransferase component